MDLFIEAMSQSKDIWPICSKKKRLFQLRTFFVRIYSEFTLLSFFLEKNYNLNDAFVKFLSSGKKGAFSFMGINSGMKMRSHRRLFFLLVFAHR